MMHAVVVYESMYGNTHAVASAIAEGMRGSCEVDLVPVEQAKQEVLAGADLLVVGGPTHMYGMSRPSTRKAAADAAHKPGGPALDPEAEGPGLREWLEGLAGDGTACAAFDTRLKGMPVFTGHAGRGISRRLRQHGYRPVAGSKSFVVDKRNHLVPGEMQRAAQWGHDLVAS
jgi:hypothetical protein